MITWDGVGEKLYETGVDRCVHFIYDADKAKYTNGVAWNGITAITETPSGAEPNDQYADNIKYLSILSAEDFGATIEAFTYPDQFAQCDGSVAPVEGVYIHQQPRKTFGLCYRTQVGNDTEGQAHGYKYHFMYGAQASPSEKGYTTINDSPEAITFSWEVTTTPVPVTGYSATALVTIDTTKLKEGQVTKLEQLLNEKVYADDDNSELPLPDDIIAAMKSA